MKKSGLRYLLSVPVEIFNNEDGAEEPEGVDESSVDEDNDMSRQSSQQMQFRRGSMRNNSIKGMRSPPNISAKGADLNDSQKIETIEPVATE